MTYSSRENLLVMFQMTSVLLYCSTIYSDHHFPGEGGVHICLNDQRHGELTVAPWSKPVNCPDLEPFTTPKCAHHKTKKSSPFSELLLGRFLSRHDIGAQRVELERMTRRKSRDCTA